MFAEAGLVKLAGGSGADPPIFGALSHPAEGTLQKAFWRLVQEAGSRQQPGMGPSAQQHGHHEQDRPPDAPLLANGDTVDRASRHVLRILHLLSIYGAGSQYQCPGLRSIIMLHCRDNSKSAHCMGEQMQIDHGRWSMVCLRVDLGMQFLNRPVPSSQRVTHPNKAKADSGDRCKTSSRPDATPLNRLCADGTVEC